jgi:cytochrome P450
MCNPLDYYKPPISPTACALTVVALIGVKLTSRIFSAKAPHPSENMKDPSCSSTDIQKYKSTTGCNPLDALVSSKRQMIGNVVSARINSPADETKYEKLSWNGQNIYVITDIDTAKKVLNNKESFCRPPMMKEFSDSFHMNNVFTTHNSLFHRELKKFFMESSARAMSGGGDHLAVICSNHADKMIRKISNSFSITSNEVEGLILETMADSFFSKPDFPKKEHCAFLIKEIWSLKRSIKSALTEDAKQEINRAIKIMRDELIAISISYKKDLREAGSEAIEKLDTIYSDHGYEEAHIWNILIPIYESLSRSVVCVLQDLSKHQDIQDALYRELKSEASSDRGYIKSGSSQLHRVWNETIRIRPPISDQPRRAEANNPLNLEEGSEIKISWGLFHLRKDVWGEDSHEYRPDRWNNITRQQRKSFNPFGAGVEMCVGRKLAEFSAKSIIRKIVLETKVVPYAEEFNDTDRSNVHALSSEYPRYLRFKPR